MNTYTIFDLETSGLNSRTAEIIEISALKVENHAIVSEFTSLIKPDHSIDPASTAINGITDEMVAEAPTLQEVLLQFIEFIESDVLLGYNIASFDLPILRRYFLDLLNIDLQNEYLDVLYMARERLSFLPNCKLSTVASYLCINTTGAHRALTDCYITKSCYEQLLDIPPRMSSPKKRGPSKHHANASFTDQTRALQTLQGFLLGVIADDILTESEVFSLKRWLDANSSLAGQYPFDRVFSIIEKALDDGILEQCELDEMLVMFKKFTSPTEECACTENNLTFVDKIICLTGDFNFGSREKVEYLVKQAGGLCKSAVSGKTNYVIVGGLGSADWSCGSYGSKIKKAIELREKGKNIQIIKEDNFIKALKMQGII